MSVGLLKMETMSWLSSRGAWVLAAEAGRGLLLSHARSGGRALIAGSALVGWAFAPLARASGRTASSLAQNSGLQLSTTRRWMCSIFLKPIGLSAKRHPRRSISWP